MNQYNHYIETIQKGINTIIFDIGQVLLKYDWAGYLASFGYDTQTYGRIAEAVFKSKEWEKGDEGIVSEPEWERLMINNAPEYELEIRDVFQGIRNTISPLPYTDQLVPLLKEQGYRLYYLSNYSEKLYNETKQHMGFLSQFDGGIFSYKEKCIKPNARIYQLLIERYGICPQEALFFDDVAANVQAAKGLGLNSVVFTPDIADKMLSGGGFKGENKI